jgi:hypothetical protein
MNSGKLTAGFASTCRPSEGRQEFSRLLPLPHRLGSSSGFAVEATVGDGFGEVSGGDVVNPCEICDGSTYPQNAVVGAGR